MKFSRPQVELLREVLAVAPPEVVAVGERMTRGEVVERHEADALINVLGAAFVAEDQDAAGPTPRGRAIDDLIGIAQQMSRDFYD